MSSANKGPDTAAEAVDASKLHLLVYSFLLQNNCGRTAQAFARTSGLATSGRLVAEDTPAYLSTSFSYQDAEAKQQQKQQRQSAPDTGSSVSRGKVKASVASSSSTTSSSSSSLLAIGTRKDSAMAAADKFTQESIDASAQQESQSQSQQQQLNESGVSEADRANKIIDHHIEYLRIRQSICLSIKSGEPKVALDLLSTYFRTVLIPPPSECLPESSLPTRSEFNATILRFRLDTQYYVELVANGQLLDALKFGQSVIWRYPDIFDTWLSSSLIQQTQPRGDQQSAVYVSREELKLKRAEIMQHITNVAALVSYTDPRKSILAYLLDQERRNELATTVNDAILESMHFPKEPALVTLVRQLATTSAYLVGYRSSSNGRAGGVSSGNGTSTTRDSSTAGADSAMRQQPWGLDTFVNSDSTVATPDSYV
ncbi:hypothetical protein IW150_000017 [Coemansia sp. RSA 2607]|nr:hypothetical protein IW150_000017 [Coemansia sp. RSA 2607]